MNGEYKEQLGRTTIGVMDNALKDLEIKVKNQEHSNGAEKAAHLAEIEIAKDFLFWLDNKEIISKIRGMMQ